MQGFVENGGGKGSDALEPGFKVRAAADPAIHLRAVIKTVARSIGIIPVNAVEAIAMVDHGGDETARCEIGTGTGIFLRQDIGKPGAVENALAGIGIGGPLVESKDRGEVVNVAAGGQLDVGQDIVDGQQVGITGKARAEVPTRGRGVKDLSAQDSDAGRLREEFSREVDDLDGGAGDAQVVEDALGDPFVDQGTEALGVGGKLHHIMMAVGGFDQMGLGAAAEVADPGQGVDWHE